jgi:hypothetical protein
VHVREDGAERTRRVDVPPEARAEHRAPPSRA